MKSSAVVSNSQDVLSGYRQRNRDWFSKQFPLKKNAFVSFGRGIALPKASFDEPAFLRMPKLQKQGVACLSWTEALQDRSLNLGHLLSLEAPPSSQAQALVNASFNAGFVLVIDSESNLSEPISWSIESRPNQVVKSAVVIRSGVKDANLIETLSGNPDFLHSSSVFLEDNSSAALLRLFGFSGRGLVFSGSQVGRDSGFVSSNAFLDPLELKQSNSNSLIFPGARVEQFDFGLGSASQLWDLSLSNNHVAANCFSRSVFRTVMTDRSHCGFEGMIRILPNAQVSDALLECHGMLLSDKSSANLVPSLEIAADDVKATHSASMSQIGEDELFYLQSKGIPLSICQKLVLSGFLESVASRLPKTLAEKALVALEHKIKSAGFGVEEK